MTEEIGKEVKAVLPTFIGFVMRILNEIWQDWSDDKPVSALSKAVRFVLFLPEDLKKDLRGPATKITKEINQAYKLEGVDFYTTQLVRNREARRIAYLRLPGFIDQLTGLLDKRGYLEKVKEFRRGSFNPRA